MGQQPGKEDKNAKQLVMKVTNQSIILHPELKMTLTIGDLEVFPHGLDGLKLWDAGIVLSRFIIKHHDHFKDKDVLELGSGVGIGGLAARKWTQCKNLIMTDYHPAILDNIAKNCTKNSEEIDTVLFDWRTHVIENKIKEQDGKDGKDKKTKDKNK